MGEGGEQVGGGSAPRLGAHLQPQNQGFLAHQIELRELHSDGFATDERVEAEQAARRMAELLADASLVDRLRRDGFRGPAYEIFTVVLTGYGLPVTRAWIRRGQIFRLVADRGRPVRSPDGVRAHLAGPAGDDDRQELALETVAAALRSFREHALVPGLWSPAGGASLTTFFAGSCVLEFPNVFRAWLVKEYEPRRQLLPLDRPVQDNRALLHVDPASAMAPAELAITAVQFGDALAAATDPRLREALLRLVHTGAEYSDIAVQVGMTEAALKMAISRYRKKVRAAREGGRP
ncbi:hypothetical protein [Actinokineospora sp. NPDC004072]